MGVPVHPGDVQRAVRAEVREHRDPVGQQRAGGVKLATVEPPTARAVGGQRGPDVAHMPGVRLRLGIAEPAPSQYLPEQRPLIFIGGWPCAISISPATLTSETVYLRPSVMLTVM